MMIKNGWIDEVKILMEKQEKNKIDFPAMDSIGYKQIQSYIRGHTTLDEIIEEINVKTRQFARKQRQWFNKEIIDLFVEMDSLKNKKIDQILHDLLRTLV